MGRNVFCRIRPTDRRRWRRLWQLGVLQNIQTVWIVIGVVILLGVGIMVSVANSGTKENIQIDRK
jgi:hypothetical protein